MTENNNNDNIIEENKSNSSVKGQIKDWCARHPGISVIICLFLLGSLVSLSGCKDKSDAADSSNANSAAANSSNTNSAAAEEMPEIDKDRKARIDAIIKKHSWHCSSNYGIKRCSYKPMLGVKGYSGDMLWPVLTFEVINGKASLKIDGDGKHTILSPLSSGGTFLDFKFEARFEIDNKIISEYATITNGGYELRSIGNDFWDAVFDPKYSRILVLLPRDEVIRIVAKDFREICAK